MLKPCIHCKKIITVKNSSQIKLNLSVYPKVKLTKNSPTLILINRSSLKVKEISFSYKSIHPHTLQDKGSWPTDVQWVKFKITDWMESV